MHAIICTSPPSRSYTFTTSDTQTPEPVSMTTKGFYGYTQRYSKSTEYDSLPLVPVRVCVRGKEHGLMLHSIQSLCILVS